MDYGALVAALYAQNQFAIKYDLASMRVAVDLLGVAEPARRLVLVGGTNGKGGTCAHLNALGMAAGLRTGLYTSPHLVDFRERIRVGGTPITEADAARIGGEVFARFSGRDRPAETPRPLSYFELTTLMAFVAFAEAGLDLGVIEVGLGGRLDATNVIDPDVSVITSVSVDHEAWLGTDLDGIAREKAGIARTGRPTFVHMDAGGFQALEPAVRAHGADVRVVTAGTTPEEWAAALARETFSCVFPDYATDGVFRRAAAAVRWPGRRQVLALGGGRTLLVDGAHNPAAAAASAAWIAGELDARRVECAPALLGVTGGRDPVVLAAELAPRVSEFVATAAGAATAAPADHVARRLREAGLVARVAPDMDAALEALGGAPVAVVTGSLYLVGDVLASLGYTPERLPVYVESPPR